MRSLPSMRRLLSMAAATSILLTAGCTVTGPVTPAAAPIDIGVDLPLSGAESRAGGQALNGIRFYFQQHPLIGGFRVVLKIADDAASRERGAANVRGFTGDPNLAGMLGPLDSAVARAEIPFANAAALAMVTPATSSVCLTRDVFLPAELNPARTAISCKDAGLPPASDLRPSGVNNFFRLTTTDDLQGPAAADYAVNTLHMSRVAVISDDETYGDGLATAFSARFQRLGGTLAGRFDLDPKSPDASAFLEQMKNAHAEGVYFGGTSATHGCQLRAAMKSLFPEGAATPFLSGDGIADDPACIAEAGGNTAGIYATVPFVDATANSSAAATIASFRASYGRPSDYGPYTMLAYDAAGVLSAAVERAAAAAGHRIPPPGNVISQLSVTQGFAGQTGTIGFDGAGDTTNRVVSLLEPAVTDPSQPWKAVTSIDYTAKPPY